MCYTGTNVHDLRLNFEADTFENFRALAYLAVKGSGPRGWVFERNGVEYDPRTDLDLPEEMFDEHFEPTWVDVNRPCVEHAGSTWSFR